MTDPAISAIVVSYHTGHRLKECLYALVSDPDVTEVWIVNNGNPTEMMIWLDQFVAGRRQVHMITGQGNIGFGAAVNLAAKRAAGPHLLVLNPDAVLRRGSLRGMQAVASTAPDPWIIGGKIFDLYGQEERGPRRRELTLWRAMTSFVGWNTWTLERSPAPKEPIEIPVISGAFFLMDKAGFDTLNGFDEDYFLHVEDVDICRRCRQAGGRVLYDPRAAALHYGATSNESSRTVAMHKADSLRHYFRKFSKTSLERLIIAEVMPLIRAALWLRAR